MSIILDSGTYTPTLTDINNVASATAYTTGWSRTGDFVTVAGRFDIDPTSATDTIMTISLPVASNIGAIADGGGTAVTVSGTSVMNAAIQCDPSGDQMIFFFYATTASPRAWYFQFSYRVI